MTEVIAGTNSFSKMIKAKMIQARQDGMYIQLKNVHDKKRADGSNWNRRNMQAPATLAHAEEIAAHIMAGGQVPPIEVQAREGGGVQKVDGYCRSIAWGIADAGGEGEIWVNIVPFAGTELEALARIQTSNKDRKLTPLEQLDLYKSVRQQLVEEGNEKPSLQDIADIVKVSRQYVDSILKLDALDEAGKALVEEGRVTVAVAVKAVRASGEDATALLEEAVKKAEEHGKPKVTAKVAKEITVGNSILLDIHQIGLNLRSNINKDTAKACEQFLRGDIKGTASVTLPVRDVAMLLAAISEGERQVEEGKKRAQAKADKAKQQSLPESPDLGEPERPLDTLEQQELDDRLAELNPVDEREEEFNIPDDDLEIPEIPDNDEDGEDENSFAFLG